jgi:hypothetical protein
MANPTIKIVNVETGEEIERPMTEAEFKSYKEFQAQAKAEAEAAGEKQAARQSALEKLAALGLTEAEIQALAG